MEEDWQSQKYRQSVVAKISEIWQNNTMDPSKNPNVMENHIFKKAKSREEYLGLVAKLFIHFREMGNRPHHQQQQQQQNRQTGGDINSAGVQDPINALQNLAVQGNRNPQMMQIPNNNQPQQMGAGGPVSIMGVGNVNNSMGPVGNVPASNLLQTLTRPNSQLQIVQGIRNVNANNLNPQINNINNFNAGINMNIVGAGQNSNTVGNTGVNSNQIQMGQSQITPNQINPNQLASNQIAANQMISNQIAPNQIGNANQMHMPNNIQNQPINQIQNVGQMTMNQINQNQLNIGNINHPQINQMMNRINSNPAMNSMNQNNIANQMNVPQNVPNQGDINTNVLNQQAVLTQPTGQTNPQPNINQMMNMQNIVQKPTNIVNNANIFPTNRNVGQTQFLRQSPSPTVASPASINQAQHQSNQMIPSPALVQQSSPQMANVMSSNQRALRQSPNAPLNTPGQVTGSSPFNPQEDQLYREKYKQLTKYIEPLRRMVAKIGNDDVEKITKMNKLLEILTNPQQRIPLETLLKCEKALEKMDLKSCSYPFSGHQFGSNNPLLEAVNATLQNPIGNHTLQRTFRPCLDALFGSDIKSFPLIDRQILLTAQENQHFSGSEIPHVLQGEIARLDQKFKVTLDPSSQIKTNIIKLICCIDDKRLPCVPPLIVTIPEDYPITAPICSLTQQEYSATPFLMSVKNALMTRVSKLPKFHSLSHLLDTWEMSVRHACSPKAVQLEQAVIEQMC